ncbi:MAG: hypothetical protein ACPG6V_09800 [Flavobacteriales bacterium]
MNVTRENKVVLEFEGQTQISIFKKVIEKCTSKGSTMSALFSSAKQKFTPEEKDFIIRLNDELENITE